MKSTNEGIIGKIVIFLLIILILLTLITSFYGVVDLGDYIGVTKYFAGDYPAKLRTSHSISYGLLHAPFVAISGNLLLLKAANLFWLLLIVYSVYIISNRNKKTILLLLLSPIVWYIAPHIGPIQLASLLFLWGYAFLIKFQNNGDYKALIFSGISIGLAATFWNSALFITAILIICFFFDKKVSQLILFTASVIAGFAPLLILDIIIYRTPGYTFIKFLAATFAAPFFGGIYGQGIPKSFIGYITILCLFPFFGYALFRKDFLKDHKIEIIFLTISYLFILLNPQPRYLFFLWPILILLLSKSLKDKQIIKQGWVFFIISLIVIAPYVIQINYSMNLKEYSSIIQDFKDWSITKDNPEKSIADNLNLISKEYPHETFLVGNDADDYEYLARVYWGKNIRELVSIQDYMLWAENKTVIWQKIYMPDTRIEERRQIWIGGGLNKNKLDNTNYSDIKYALGFNEPIKIENFKFLKRYGNLYLSENI